jgi:hypothetical protein
MTTFPADERTISEVERGRSCEAALPLPPGKALAAGDTVLFTLARSPAGREPSFVKGGDSVLVSLTGVTGLDETDPATGRALYRLTWEPLGRGG